ncbi:MAG: flagellar basal body-associated FliL family protein [Rhodobacteraceae bacterium]|nr:flagellar basal body-associated FliL family protein [Paracoccaceae bacterium]
MRKLLPVFLILAGLGVGTAGGFLLRPAPVAGTDADAPHPETAHAPADAEHLPEFVKLTNQFVVPVVEAERIASLVILSLSLEVTAGSTETVYAQEPKLRDAVLQLLFDHANTGGFRGSFTDADNLVILRRGLLEVVKAILGDLVTNVLITDIVRQDS